MSIERGDVVMAMDPFRTEESSGRPFLVVSSDETPFHGEQFICLALTTRTWYDERIALADEDWVEGGAPESSAIMPWSVNALKREWIEYRQGRIRDAVVAQTVDQLVDYVT